MKEFLINLMKRKKNPTTSKKQRVNKTNNAIQDDIKNDTSKVVDKTQCYPIVYNDILMLSWPLQNIYGEKDIYYQKRLFFDVILNETKEKVGEINCHLGDEFQYGGNVDYFIYEKYRHHHYATMALELLKQLLQNNLSNAEKILYISTLPEDTYSQKVAQNNNAELYYDGEVPVTDSLNYINGVKKIKIYKIDIEN